MLEPVDVGTRSLAAYRGLAPDAQLDALRRAAEPLRGKRVLHLNATSYGGGVSELLRSLVPLMDDLGIEAEWKTILGDEAFFKVTKHMHNALQGHRGPLTHAERCTFEANARRNARGFRADDYDVIVVHDPQPAALLPFVDKGDATWVWRCHIDTSDPEPAVWNYLRTFLDDYDASIFTLGDFVPPQRPTREVALIPPAIDPLSPKNLPLPDPLALQVLDWMGLDPQAPLVTQVSRFDPWKDPLGVVEAYRQAREEVPDLQLVLAGSMALDDPEGWGIYHQLLEEARKDPQLHVLTNTTGVGNIEINALQRLSDVVVQKSLREGFGLVVAEALWKGTPVVAGRVGGIPLQMAEGLGGSLVDSVDQCAEAMVRYLQHPSLAAEVAARGQERVRQHFLLPRLLLDELALLGRLLGVGEAAPAAIPLAQAIAPVPSAARS